MDTALAQLTARIAQASADKLPLRIRGGGTKDFYGNTPRGDVLDTTGLRGIVSYEPTELVVTARAGTPLAELEAVLAERRQCLAFEPPHYGYASGNATVGGMVAAGLSGPARASVGAVRDYVLGVKLLNGRGEHLVFGGQVMKNVAGYDVSRLMAGSMGVLGVITEVSLKVLPMAPAEATLVFELDQAEALAQLHRWGAQPLPLNASCWVRDGDQSLLFVRLRGAVAAVASAVTRMTRDAGGHQMDNAQAMPDWQACRDHRLPIFVTASDAAPDLWRLSLPQTAPVLDLPWAQLVEWHGAQRWLRAPSAAAAGLRELVARYGGSATLFVATQADDPQAENRFSPLAPALRLIHQRLKAEFDPDGIFDADRLFAEL
ncbi:glycolate oxidase subunit GlcE [Rhodoferax sp.]|uniref:glycolate oxidase subunit GlcE n=1 Tax=Rhodoferax sp. TaxID=50421 RepID=UPI00276960F8|nr:glycolate oxidase subunit GlcE [Rhodoferax sp.]